MKKEKPNNVTITGAYKARTVRKESINGPIHWEHPLFPLQQAHRVTKELFYQQILFVKTESEHEVVEAKPSNEQM